MAAASANVLNYQATDADHRTFAQGIHNLLIAAGLTQTSDTGQANLATITRPAANTVSGFEIFRFNDAEQATLPCFIKLSYGSTAAQTVPGLNLILGTGSNGTGTITGSIQPLPNVYGFDGTADSIGQVRPAFVSYAEGQLVIAFGLDGGTGRGMTWYIGRPRTFDGSRTTDGFIWITYTVATSAPKSRVVYRAGGGGPAALAGSVSVGQFVTDTLTGQDDQVGGNIALWPMYVGVNGNMRFGSLFGYRAAAILADAQQDISVFGGSKTYRTLGGAFQVGSTAIMVPYF